jgi:hypothetical protein
MLSTVDPRSLPNLVVIGGTKSGTTSLHAYLALHPQIFMSREKEVQFFTKHFDKGVAWYAAHFRKGRAHAVRGEASPQYTCHPRITGIPERMRAVIPDAKLVYLVRDPFARLRSHVVFMAPHWAHRMGPADGVRAGLDALLDPFDTNPYVAQSRQAWQLERYLAVFPPERILVIAAEDLRDARRATLAAVFRFLEVDPFDSPDFDAELNPTEVARRDGGVASRLIHAAAALRPGRFVPARIGLPLRNRALRMFSRPTPAPPMSPALEARLRELFAADAARLRRLTGLSLDGWSV